jgi:glutamine synthetase
MSTVPSDGPHLTRRPRLTSHLANGAVADRLLTVQEALGPLDRSTYLAVKRSEAAAFAADDAAFEYRQHLMKF